MEEILINFTRQEARIALIENAQLQEIYVERTNKQGILGNIYKGRVSRLAPGMQAAFIDIGIERSAFLHISDTLEFIKNKPNNKELEIEKLLKPGQEILVQVYKDTIGTKGARLTTQFGIPSRYLVLTPNLFEINVSQKITNPIDRERMLKSLSPSEIGGYIFRTVTEEATQEEILADQALLHALWEDALQRAKQVKPGQVVYQELPIALRVLRDLASPHIKKILVDDKIVADEMHSFAARFIPHLDKCIEYYDANSPLFDRYGVEGEIQRSLERKVHLKSGGYIVLDQTEALTTIDVNTGSFLGKSDSEQTIFQTNLEAVDAIARQIKLRNLGGIIIIDFIDMEELSNRERLIKSLTNAVAKDTARVEISDVSTLGLVQMTRKRTRESLEHVLCDPCPACQKRGFIKSVETICYDIFREIQRLAALHPWPGFIVQASIEVIEYLKSNEVESFAELEMKLSRPIQLKIEMSYGREQYGVLPADIAAPA